MSVTKYFYFNYYFSNQIKINLNEEIIVLDETIDFNRNIPFELFFNSYNEDTITNFEFDTWNTTGRINSSMPAYFEINVDSDKNSSLTSPYSFNFEAIPSMFYNTRYVHEFYFS